MRDGMGGYSPTLSRNGAFRSAKEKAGIPRSQQPDNIYREKIRDQTEFTLGRVYEFKKPDGSTSTIREHSFGHSLGNHGPHFNTEFRSLDGTKQPLSGSGNSHSYFK